MDCVLIFNINGKLVELNIPIESKSASSTTIDEIKEALRGDVSKREEIAELTHKALNNGGILKSVSDEDLVSIEGLQGNCDLDYLRTITNGNPNIRWPEGAQANILLVNNLRTYKSIKGRVINSKGEELFVVSGKEGDLSKLANFLRFRSLILKYGNQLEGEDEKMLEEIRVKTNSSLDKSNGSVEEMLLDFLYNRKSYNKAFIEGIDVYSYLQDILYTILEFNYKERYDDRFVQSLQAAKTINKKQNTASVSIDRIFAAVQSYFKDDSNNPNKRFPNLLENLGVKNQSLFVKLMNKPASEIKDSLKKVFPEDTIEGTGWETLFRNLLEIEPEFRYKFKEATSKTVIFENESKSLEKRYGIGYDTMHTFDFVDKNFYGYKIYRANINGKEKYFPTRKYITEESTEKGHNSIEAARDYIEFEVLPNTPIHKNNFLEFKYRHKAVVDGVSEYSTELDTLYVGTSLSFNVGDMIDSLDIPIIKTKIFYQNELELFSKSRSYKPEKFYEIVDSWEISDGLKESIKNGLRNSEQITAFIYKLNELAKDNRNNEELISNIFEKVVNAKTKQYYISTKLDTGNGYYRYRVIPVDSESYKNYRKNKSYPNTRFMQALAATFDEKFKVKVNLVNASLIATLFNGEEIDPNTARAFIKDGQIYINTTIANGSDLLHEYTHLILGTLKANPELRLNYELLMALVLEKSLDRIEKKKETYPNRSMMDLAEEVFAERFSHYLMDHLSGDCSSIFKANEKFLKDATQNIFKTRVYDLKSFYGKSLEDVFMRFNSDVAALLQKPDLDFSNSQTSRRYSDWISKHIGKELIEKCK